MAWRQLRTQIALFDKAVSALVQENRVCRLLMSVPGIGVLTALGFVSTIEKPERFARSRAAGARFKKLKKNFVSTDPMLPLAKVYPPHPEPDRIAMSRHPEEPFEVVVIRLARRRRCGAKFRAS